MRGKTREEEERGSRKWVPGLRIYLYIYLSFFFSIAYCAYNGSMSEYRGVPIYTIINYLCTFI